MFIDLIPCWVRELGQAAAAAVAGAAAASSWQLGLFVVVDGRVCLDSLVF